MFEVCVLEAGGEKALVKDDNLLLSMLFGRENEDTPWWFLFMINISLLLCSVSVGEKFLSVPMLLEKSELDSVKKEENCGSINMSAKH